MTSPVYSSIEAFLTHWRALRKADARPAGTAHRLNAAESELLQAMDTVARALTPAELAAIGATDAANPAAQPSDLGARERRRQRALTRLSAILTASGWLR